MSFGKFPFCHSKRNLTVASARLNHGVDQKNNKREKKTVILYDISRVYSLEKFSELNQKGIAILRIGVEEK